MYLVVVNSISQLLGIVLHTLGAALPQELHVLLGGFPLSDQKCFYSVFELCPSLEVAWTTSRLAAEKGGRVLVIQMEIVSPKFDCSQAANAF